MARTGTPTIIVLVRKICKMYNLYGAANLEAATTPAYAAAVAALAVACHAFEALDDFPGQIDYSGTIRPGEDIAPPTGG